MATIHGETLDLGDWFDPTAPTNQPIIQNDLAISRGGNKEKTSLMGGTCSSRK